METDYVKYFPSERFSSYEEYIEYLKMKGFAIDCNEYFKMKYIMVTDYVKYFPSVRFSSYEEYIEYLKMKGFAVDCSEYL